MRGGTPDQHGIMASALCHCPLALQLFVDGDGRTMGLDGKVHMLPQGARAYSAYSPWDSYRALHPLLTIIQPDRAAPMTRDLIRQTQQNLMARRSGRSRPRRPAA